MTSTFVPRLAGSTACACEAFAALDEGDTDRKHVERGLILLTFWAVGTAPGWRALSEELFCVWVSVCGVARAARAAAHFLRAPIVFAHGGPQYLPEPYTPECAAPQASHVLRGWARSAMSTLVGMRLCVNGCECACCLQQATSPNFSNAIYRFRTQTT